jgi:hypothetical protein
MQTREMLLFKNVQAFCGRNKKRGKDRSGVGMLELAQQTSY